MEGKQWAFLAGLGALLIAKNPRIQGLLAEAAEGVNAFALHQAQQREAQQQAALPANRRVLESLDNAESQLSQVCALVEDNLKSLDYSGKREALDAIGARVMVSPDHTVFLGHIPSYVTIAQTSA